jgi:hypothetical protein
VIKYQRRQYEILCKNCRGKGDSQNLINSGEIMNSCFQGEDVSDILDTAEKSILYSSERNQQELFYKKFC